MSTRSITTVKSRWDDLEWKTLAVIYRHSDGYLSDHGERLAGFLDGLEVVNGLTGDEPPKYVNGPGQLAARLISELWSNGIRVSLVSHNQSDFGQEFHYEILVQFGERGGNVFVKVYDGPMTCFGEGGDECNNEIFSGNVAEYVAFIRSGGKEIGE